MEIRNYGSVCSGIEAAGVVLRPLGVEPLWLSEVADFPCRFLSLKYPGVPNLGDMANIPGMISDGIASVPDLLVGGTPCQAFSFAGKRKGTEDERGRLTLKYIGIIDSIDRKRSEQGKGRAVFFWENVLGVLTDKTNAFGCFLAGLAGMDEPIGAGKFKHAGVLHGKERNIAWRVLDAKYFGIPQQRKRVYVVGGGKGFNPEEVLFEKGGFFQDPWKSEGDCIPLDGKVNGHEVEAFRAYSDCLYAGYGTKWNGNAAAFNGSLFFSQDGRLRRLSPIECERLMGLPDDYTSVGNPCMTARYRAIGNSWAVPVIRWIMERLLAHCKEGDDGKTIALSSPVWEKGGSRLYMLDGFTETDEGFLNASCCPYGYKLSNILGIADTEADERLYISPAGCAGILKRKEERRAGMPPRMETILNKISYSKIK